jgi:uncharacterized membrane protein
MAAAMSTDLPTLPGRWHEASSGMRLAISGAVGLAVGLAATVLAAHRYAPVLGWDAAAVTFLVGSWLAIWRLSEAQTAASATREDPSTALSDVVLLTAAVASLLTVALVLFGAGQDSGPTEVLRVLLGVASVALSWAVVHTLFCLKYARLYYQAPAGGIDFHQEGEPEYADFAYLAFTVGMTFQVSDTDVTSKDIRRAVLRHALVAFLFGAVILAVTINLVAGLSK